METLKIVRKNNSSENFFYYLLKWQIVNGEK